MARNRPEDGQKFMPPTLDSQRSVKADGERSKEEAETGQRKICVRSLAETIRTAEGLRSGQPVEARMSPPRLFVRDAARSLGEPLRGRLTRRWPLACLSCSGSSILHSSRRQSAINSVRS